MTQTMTRSLIDSVARIAPILREHAAEAEERKTLSAAAHEAMVNAGLFRMFVPRALGGLEVDVVSGFEAIEAVARIDSAAGWNLQIGSAPTGIAALLSDGAAKEIFSAPDAVVAGGFFPPGSLSAVDGGFRLNGRWGWVSGCQQATWMVSPAIRMKDGAPEMTPDGRPVAHVCFYPATEAQIITTWDPMGMRGTGSNDIAANDVFIPTDRAPLFRPFSIDPGPSFSGPLYKLGIMPTILGNAVVALGIARRAIDESIGLLQTKTPAHFQTQPAQRTTVQMHLGRAEATLSAARAYFYDSLAAAWEVAEAGNTIGTEERKHLQLAAAYAAESAAKAVDYIHASVGGNGVLEAQHSFARHFRDVHTITQHALCSATRFESMGQVMLGMKTDWMLFDL